MMVLTAEALVLLYQMAKGKESRREADEEMQQNWDNIDYWADDQCDSLNFM